MSELELRQGDGAKSFDLYAGGDRVGSLYYVGWDDDDPEDFQAGWVAELHGSNMWQQITDYDPDIKVTIAIAQEINEEREEHEAKMRRIDRQRPRTVSIPSGGQPPR
ncbi:hypothetical protein [Streptomyces sp. NPDC005262]|uniref:hypothetical protein n=1 Tax=Streptomyces sp. NPDC005262 TaxID=3364710 RepID=UPI00369C8DE3